MAPEEAQNGRPAAEDEFAQLSALLLGAERAQLLELRQRLDDPGTRAEDVAAVLAEAVKLRAAKDNRLRKSLQATIEEALGVSVRKNPRTLADALYPVFGRAVRKSITSELQGMMEGLNQIMEQSVSLRSLSWRWEAMRTGKSYAEIVLLRSLLFRVDQAFLIHRKTGLLLEHAVAEGSVVKNPEMISGMLTAIQDFVRDSFSADGGDDNELETARVGEFGVLIAYGPHAILAGVVRGTAPRTLHQTFQEHLEQIHGEAQQALAAFQGDTAPFAALRPHLEACLLGGGDQDAGKPWPVWAKRALLWGLPGLIMLALAAWGTLDWLDGRRWSAYVARLSAEPGIVVASHSRGGGGYRIAGLRDPLAADPAKLLDGTGLRGDRVSFEWESFESLAPRFAAERKYQELKASIEDRRVRFPTGSAQVLPEHDDLAFEIALRIRDLFRAAQATGRTIRVQVRGDTDPVGSEQYNATLARDRSAVMLGLLKRVGVPEQRLVPLGREGAGRPCVAETDSERALCRAVSFTVVEP